MPETPPPAEPEDRGRRLEDIFTLLCIFTLWPVLLGWQHPIYQATLYVALVGLIVILVRRVRRFQTARREVEEDLN